MSEIPKPVIMMLGTHASFFLSHRLPLARHLRDHGFRVIVATHADVAPEALLKEGLEFREIAFRRQGTNVFQELQTLLSIFRLYRRERPALVHHISHKPILYGGLAARLAGIRAVVGTLPGLGYAFAAKGLKAGAIRIVLEILYLLRGRFGRSHLIFQNPDDRAFFIDRKFVSSDFSTLILGSGVDCQKFQPQPERETEPPVVLTVSRMLWTKGIAEVIAAANILRQRGVEARFILAGPAADDNPQSIPLRFLLHWNAKGMVEWVGKSDDVSALLASAHVVCLPSYGGEGLPLALAEAAAAGRPIVTTDTPGCREVVVDGVNGFLVPVGDSVQLADRMAQLLASRDLRRRMGQAGRERALNKLSIEIVCDQTLKLYRRCRRVGIENQLHWPGEKITH